jgi:hypothetical protein
MKQLNQIMINVLIIKAHLKHILSFKEVSIFENNLTIKLNL